MYSPEGRAYDSGVSSPLVGGSVQLAQQAEVVANDHVRKIKPPPMGDLFRQTAFGSRLVGRHPVGYHLAFRGLCARQCDFAVRGPLAVTPDGKTVIVSTRGEWDDGFATCLIRFLDLATGKEPQAPLAWIPTVQHSPKDFTLRGRRRVAFR